MRGLRRTIPRWPLPPGRRIRYLEVESMRMIDFKHTNVAL